MNLVKIYNGLLERQFQTKKYQQNTKSRRNTICNNRRKTDKAYVLISNLRTRTYNVLKGKRKTIHTIDGIGCSREELVQYIESKWEDGMSWENYGNKDGQWSIDHIYPFFMCNQDDSDAIVRNNHWTNLRPMWHKDNISRTYKEIELR